MDVTHVYLRVYTYRLASSFVCMPVDMHDWQNVILHKDLMAYATHCGVY